MEENDVRVMRRERQDGGTVKRVTFELDVSGFVCEVLHKSPRHRGVLHLTLGEGGGVYYLFSVWLCVGNASYVSPRHWRFPHRIQEKGSDANLFSVWLCVGSASYVSPPHTRNANCSGGGENEANLLNVNKWWQIDGVIDSFLAHKIH